MCGPNTATVELPWLQWPCQGLEAMLLSLCLPVLTRFPFLLPRCALTVRRDGTNVLLMAEQSAVTYSQHPEKPPVCSDCPPLQREGPLRLRTAFVYEYKCKYLECRLSQVSLANSCAEFPGQSPWPPKDGVLTALTVPGTYACLQSNVRESIPVQELTFWNVLRDVQGGLVFLKCFYFTNFSSPLLFSSSFFRWTSCCFFFSLESNNLILCFILLDILKYKHSRLWIFFKDLTISPYFDVIFSLSFKDIFQFPLRIFYMTYLKVYCFISKHFRNF